MSLSVLLKLAPVRHLPLSYLNTGFNASVLKFDTCLHLSHASTGHVSVPVENSSTLTPNLSLSSFGFFQMDYQNLLIYSIGVAGKLSFSPLPEGLCLTSKNDENEIKYIGNKIIILHINSNKNKSNLFICLT